MKLSSSTLFEMAEKIIQRYPEADQSFLTWEESARIIFLSAETADQINDAVKLLELSKIWNEMENK